MSRSGGRAGMSGSPGRRSGASRSWPRTTRRCARSCGSSRASGRGGGIAKRTSICSSRAGRSTESGTQRLWREEGLRVPPKRRKRQRRGESTVPGDRLRAERPDHVWAFDFQFDVTQDGRMVKLLYVVDEFTREALAMVAKRRIDADRVVEALEALVADRGRHPEFVRCDNGPEMTSAALRDWCHFSRTGAAFIEPGSPWENPFVESFNSRVRDELLAVEVFSCLTEAQVMVEDFRQDYNRARPHRAHGMMTPAAFAAGWWTAHEAARASADRHSPYGLAPLNAGANPNLALPTNHQLSQQVDP